MLARLSVIDPITLALLLLIAAGLVAVVIGLLLPGRPPKSGVYCDDPRIRERDPLAQIRRNGGA
jgi:hypothetical protein